MNNKVSIAMPVYNGGEYFELALRSALAQTYSNIEIIVVNDGSNDGGATADIAKKYVEMDTRVKYFEQDNCGVAGALNTALSHMTGELFCWLSHDDLFEPQKTEIQLSFFSKMHALGRANFMSFSDWTLIDKNGSKISDIIYDHDQFMRTPMLPLLRGSINGCTLMIPKKIITDAGGFDTKYWHTQDYYLWNALLRQNDFFHIPRQLVRYRYHAGQDSHKQGAVVEGNSLWIAMMASRSEIEQVQLSGSRWRFYNGMYEHLKSSIYPIAAEFSERQAVVSFSDTRISVIVIVEHHSEISHLDSIIRQNYENLEILVLDLAGTDAKAEASICSQDSRVKYLLVDGCRLSEALNIGLSRATGSYIAFGRPGFMSVESRLEHQHKAMQETGAIVSHSSYYNGRELVTVGSYAGDLLPQIVNDVPLLLDTIMIHKVAIASGFVFNLSDPDKHYRKELTWLAEHYQFHGIPEPLILIEQ